MSDSMEGVGMVILGAFAVIASGGILLLVLLAGKLLGWFDKDDWERAKREAAAMREERRRW